MGMEIDLIQLLRSIKLIVFVHLAVSCCYLFCFGTSKAMTKLMFTFYCPNCLKCPNLVAGFRRTTSSTRLVHLTPIVLFILNLCGLDPHFLQKFEIFRAVLVTRSHGLLLGIKKLLTINTCCHLITHLLILQSPRNSFTNPPPPTPSNNLHQYSTGY